jgi:hypothetical protein
MITKSDPRRSVFYGENRTLKPQIINQKPALGRDLVIEQHGGLIGLMGLPIDAGTAPCAGGFCDSLNQSAARAKATASCTDIEVLEIATIAKRPIGGVINPIHHPHSLAAGVTAVLRIYPEYGHEIPVQARDGEINAFIKATLK